MGIVNPSALFVFEPETLLRIDSERAFMPDLKAGLEHSRRVKMQDKVRERARCKKKRTTRWIPPQAGLEKIYSGTLGGDPAVSENTL